MKKQSRPSEYEDQYDLKESSDFYKATTITLSFTLLALGLGLSYLNADKNQEIKHLKQQQEKLRREMSTLKNTNSNLALNSEQADFATCNQLQSLRLEQAKTILKNLDPNKARLEIQTRLKSDSSAETQLEVDRFITATTQSITRVEVFCPQVEPRDKLGNRLWGTTKKIAPKPQITLYPAAFDSKCELVRTLALHAGQTQMPTLNSTPSTSVCLSDENLPCSYAMHADLVCSLLEKKDDLATYFIK